MTYTQHIEAHAKKLADLNGLDWSDMGETERLAYREEAMKPMSGEMRDQIVAAAVHVIEETWGETLGSMASYSLGRMIAKEIEARRIYG